MAYTITSVQHLQAEIKLSSKKCACFTPGGVVYTRLETNGHFVNNPPQFNYRFGSDGVTRNKREASIDDNHVEDDAISVDDFLLEHPRLLHLTPFYDDHIEGEDSDVENVDDTLKNVNERIAKTQDRLQLYEYSLNRDKINERVKRIKRSARKMQSRSASILSDARKRAVFNNRTVNLECKVEWNGKVNCSTAVYKDFKTWHANRLSIEDQIRQLKIELEDLKEIKRHLKESRPEHAGLESDEKSTVKMDEDSDNDFNQEQSSTQTFDKFEYKKQPAVINETKNSNELDKVVSFSSTEPTYIKFIDIDKTENPSVHFSTPSDRFLSSDKGTSTLLSEDKFLISNRDKEPSQNHSNVNDNMFTPLYEREFDLENNLNNTEQRNFTDLDYERLLGEITQNETGQSYGKDELIDGDFFNNNNSTTENYEKINETDFSDPTILTNLNSQKSIDGKNIPQINNSTSLNNEVHSTAVPRRPLHQTNKLGSLGPTRLDISTYKDTIRRENDKFGFNRKQDAPERLPPFYLTNEDQHMCYCEPDR